MNKSEFKSNTEQISLIKLIQRSGRWILITLIRIYQLTISPLLGPVCRHTPSCSSYMIEAIREWGSIRGVWLGLKRIGKCQPWGTSGYDPVPRRHPKEREKLE